jgi:antitoxin VapB
MSNSTTKEIGEKRAKLFRNGRSQAVRLPKEFRFPGTEVRIRHAMGGVLLEPVEKVRKPFRSAAELFERMASFGGDPILPDGREQPDYDDERDWDAFNHDK